MRTLAVQKEIVNKYASLSKSTKIPFDKEKSIAYIWGLNNKVGNKKGFISEDGTITIETNKKAQTGNLFKDIAICLYNGMAKLFDTEIKITNNNIKKIKKPLFNSWSRTFGKINDLLEDTYKNLNNRDIVKQHPVGLLCFS